MSKYIDRDEAIEALVSDYAYAAASIIEKEIPIANVQKVRYGEWKEIRDAYGKLEGWIHTECGREVKIKENYCPDCGAKMDKGEK